MKIPEFKYHPDPLRRERLVRENIENAIVAMKVQIFGTANHFILQRME